jgi:rubrerythrin
LFKTDANLQAAFASECQAYVRYSLFASIALDEGWPLAARIFKAAAEAELVHARNHFAALGGLGNTKSNLLAGATSEQSAITTLYPDFIDQAKIDRNEAARVTFERAQAAERKHNQILEVAYRSFKEGQPLAVEAISLCLSCGNLFTGQAPQQCEICGASAGKIKEV